MIETILGLGIVLFLLLYIAFKLEKEHFILQLFLLFISLFVLLLIPKATLDVAQDCPLVINTTTLAGNTTSYTYMEQCVGNDATETTFYTITLWIIRLVSTYIVFYFLFSVFAWLGNHGKNKQK